MKASEASSDSNMLLVLSAVSVLALGLFSVILFRNINNFQTDLYGIIITSILIMICSSAYLGYISVRFIAFLHRLSEEPESNLPNVFLSDKDLDLKSVVILGKLGYKNSKRTLLVYIKNKLCILHLDQRLTEETSKLVTNIDLVNNLPKYKFETSDYFPGLNGPTTNWTIISSADEYIKIRR